MAVAIAHINTIIQETLDHTNSHKAQQIHR